jgi:hypothetical protein
MKHSDDVSNVLIYCPPANGANNDPVIIINLRNCSTFRNLNAWAIDRNYRHLLFPKAVSAASGIFSRAPA